MPSYLQLQRPPLLVIIVSLLGMVRDWSVLSSLRRSWEGATHKKD